MDELVNNAKREFVPGVALLMLSWMVLPLSFAESLKDPTRPFDMTSQGDAAAPASVAGPVLQSVLVGPDRETAIISGKSVKVGDFYGNFRVSRITDTEVTLVRGREVQVLKLFSGPEKRLHISPAVRGAVYASGGEMSVPADR
jgi:hypothetical protein